MEGPTPGSMWAENNEVSEDRGESVFGTWTAPRRLPSTSSHADSQMSGEPFFSSIANDGVICLDLKDLQVLLSSQ